MTQAELELAWEQFKAKGEPDLPFWIDGRPIDYALTQSATERLRRLELCVTIDNRIHLADIETLERVALMLHESAQKNPFWNEGNPDEMWVNDLHPNK